MFALELAKQDVWVYRSLCGRGNNLMQAVADMLESRMIPKALADITPEDLDALIEHEVRESRTLDFKRDLPGTSDGEKKEFLADVVSFANAGGGDIVYGIGEKVDDAGRNTGVAGEVVGIGDVNEDEATLRLTNLIRDGTEPRVPGVSLRFITTGEARKVLILRLPRSWAAPHMRSFKSTPLFYSRTSAGKYPLDVRELQAAFEQAQSAGERIRAFRVERLGRVEEILDSRRFAALHVLPWASLNDPQAVDLRDIATNYQDVIPRGDRSNGWRARFNFEGVVVEGRSDSNVNSYLQVFRNGSLELATHSPFQQWETNTIVFMADMLARFVLVNLAQLLDLLQRNDVPPPYFVALSIFGAEGVRMTSKEFGNRISASTEVRLFDRNELVLPPMMLDDSKPSLPDCLRSTLDTLWQAAGLDRCFHYDAITGAFERSDLVRV